MFALFSSLRRGRPRLRPLRPRMAVEELEPRVLLAGAAYLAPGQPGQSVRAQFRWLSERADYRNEMGLFRVDDAQGRIGTLLPGDPGYAAQALDRGRRQILFHRGQRPGKFRTVDLPGGGCFGLYLISDGSTEQFLRRNPDNARGRSSPFAVFNFGSANPDGVGHVRLLSRNRFAFEDAWRGGDRDFDDFIGSVTFLAPTTPTVPTPPPSAVVPSPAPRLPPIGIPLPLDDTLGGWTVTRDGPPDDPGTVTAKDGWATLREGSAFTVSLARTFTLPAEPSALTFLFDGPTFDTTAAGQINDAFEAAILDAAGRPLVHPVGAGTDAFFNFTEGLTATPANGVTVTGQTATVNLAGLPAGSQATILFRLVNNDRDRETTVRLNHIRVVPTSDPTPEGVTAAALRTAAVSNIDFDGLHDVTASVAADYGRTTFPRESSVLHTDLLVRNAGDYHLDAPLLVAVENLSDPSVRVRDFDGLTPDGTPFYDLSDRVTGGTLLPGQTAAPRRLAFFNPGGGQFTYDLVFLAGLNRPPTFTSAPDVEALVDRPYFYAATANDPDADALTFALLQRPASMAVNPATGVITWAPTAADVGTHAVNVRVEDGRGGTAEQDFVVSVLADVPNRPPVFTSTPVTTARVNTEYTYPVAADDADGDPLMFTRSSGPTNLAVNGTGAVTWTPTAAQLGPQDVTLQVADGRGGVATQTFTIRVLQEAGNAPPVIVSDPITHFSLPGMSNPASGAVSPEIIDLELGAGDVHTQSISITLPAPPPPPPPPPGQGPLAITQQEDANLLADALTAGNKGLAITNVRLQGQARAVHATLPADGEYVLVVGNNGGAGPQDYTFRLDTRPEPTVTPQGFGEVHFGELAANEVKPFDFMAPAGTVVYYDSQFHRAGMPVIVLTEPYIEQVGAGPPNVDMGPFVLPRSGPYRLTLTGIAAPVDYRFRLLDLGTSALPLTLGQPVQSTLTSGRETVVYRFQGTPGQQVYFDDLDLDGEDLVMSLVGPDHKTKFLGSASGNSDGDDGPATLTQAGTYYLFLSGDEPSGTPDYRFRLIDVSTTSVLSLDQEVPSTLEAGAPSDVYHFQGTAGQRLFFDILQPPANATWALFEPGDQQLAGLGATSVTDFEVTLTKTGRHVLVMNGNNAAAAPYRFKVVTPDVHTAPLTLNALTTGTITEPGEQDEHTFTGSVGQRLYYDAQTAFPARLVSPTGDTVFTTTLANNGGPVTLTEAGVYRLVVDPLGDDVGNYRFRLLDVADQPLLPLDQEVSDTLDPGLASHVYRIDGAAGRRLYFDSLQTATGNWTLYGPDNGAIGSPGVFLSGDIEATLATTGTHLLVLAGTSTSAPVPYRFRAVTADVTTAPLTLNDPVNGTIAEPGDQREHTFTGSVGQRLYYDSLNSFNARLVSPSGVNVFSQIGDAGPVTLTETGTYRLVIDPVGDDVGNYRFRLLDLADQPPLMLNTTVNNTLDPGLASHVFRFAGIAGQRLNFDSLVGSGSAAWTLHGPGNQNLGRTFLSNDFNALLPTTGVYALVLDGNSTTTPVNCSFRVTDVSDAPVAASGFGTVHNGAIAAGEERTFEYTASAGLLVYFDAQDNRGSNLVAQLRDPTGALVFSVLAADDAGPFFLPRSGSCTLTVRGPGSGTGNFQFRLVDVAAAATPLTSGNTVTETLASGLQTVVYSFAGSVGQRLYYDSLENDPDLVELRLVRPSNAVELTNNNSDANEGPFTVREAGMHYLFLKGAQATGDADYSFRLLDAASADPLPLDSEVNGTLDPGHSTRLYRLQGVAGQRLYFDTLTSGVGVGNWALYGPTDHRVGGNALNGDFEVTLPSTGTYVLELAGNSATSPVPYRFRVVTPEVTSEPLTLETTVSGTITEPGEQDEHTFTGSPGQRVYFDDLASLPLRLVSPTGDTVFTGGGAGDLGSFTLTEAGTHRLIVDPDRDTIGDYSFRLLDLATAIPVSLDTVVEGALPLSRQAQLYQFNGAAGQHLVFNGLMASSGVVWSLRGPGDQSFGDFGALGDFERTLPDTGVYTLAVRGTSATIAVNYRFQILTPEVIRAPMTLNDPIDFVFAEMGEVHEFTFTGTAGQRLFFDMHNPAVFLVTATLFGPSGVNAAPPPLGTLNELSVLTLTETGTYRLVLDGPLNATGPFGFRLLDVSVQQVLALNTDVVGRLDPRKAMQVYRFTGERGQRVRFSSPATPGLIDWDIYGVGPSSIAGGAIAALGDRFGNNDTLGRSTAVFTNTGNVFNLPASGIVISTGDVRRYGSGPNLARDRTTAYFPRASLAQEALLDPITGSFDHYDVTQLDITFDALPSFDKVFFTVVFGSEEYPEFVSSDFLDGFGLFLNGVNLATVGGQPVNIKHEDMKVLPGTELDGVLAPNDNPLLTFSASVEPGSKGNVLTFIVADTSDQIYDTTAYISSLSALPPGPLDIDVIATDPNGGFVNRTGVRTGVERGQPATFNARFTGDGTAHSFDLVFVRAGTSNVLGSIPVTISNDYRYPAAAIDPDGDTLIWSLMDESPDDATIDPSTGKIRWEPSAPGQYRFVVRVEDGRGGVDTQEYTVNVTRGTENKEPVITSTAPTQATAGLPFAYSVKATDADGDLLSYYLTDPPADMQIDRTTGVLSWTPTTAQIGSHAVTVRVLDGSGGSVAQSFTITVIPDTANRKPTVTSQPVTLAVVEQTYRYAATATDLDADRLTFDLVVRPDGMNVDPRTGVIVWQPDEEDIGKHSVFLRVSDGRGGVDLHTFELNVTAGGTAPVITTAPPTAPAVVGEPFAYQVHAQDAENDALTFRLDARPEGMGINQTGSITWTPTADQVGAQSVTVTVEDGLGGRATVTLPLTVVAAAPNTPPQITSTPRQRIGLGTAYFYAVQAVDADNDALTLSLPTFPTGMQLINGMITWTPTPDQLGTHAVTVRVEDGRGGVDVDNFTVTVESRNANRTPRILPAPVFTAFAGGEYRYDVQGADPDGDPLTWSLDRAPAGMSINPLLGTVRWAPTLEDVGEHEVAVRLFDAQGGTTTQAFTVLVQANNRPPMIRSAPPTVAVVEQTYTYAVGASDPDDGPLSFSLPTRPAGMEIGPTGVITWVPTAAQLGTFDVQVRVEDSAGGRATQVYTVVATPPPNDAPVITSTPTLRAVVDTPFGYAVTASDPEGAALVFSLVGTPTDMTIDPSTGAVAWTPTAAQVGTHSVTVVATDPGGAAARQTFTLVIRAQNRAPLITSSPRTQVTAGAPYRYDVRATDADGDRLTYSLIAGPQNMEMDARGRITWSPVAADVGTQAVRVAVSDGLAAAVEQAFDILVQADTQLPRITLSSATGSVSVGGSLTFVINASDDVGVASRQLTVDGVAVPLDANGRATVPFPTIGVVEVIATAQDAAGNAASATRTVVVLDPTVTGAPTVSLDALPGDGVVTSPTDIRGTASDPNLREYTLEVRPLTGGAFREIARGTTAVTNDVLGRFDPTLLPNDTYILRLTATDTGNNTASTQIQVEVVGELKVGNFTLSFADLTIPVSGIPIQVTRTYDTMQANQDGDFGFGWRLEFRDTRLRTSVPRTGLEADGIFNGFTDGARVYLTLPGGKRQGFTFRPTEQRLFATRYYIPTFVPDPGVTSRLSVPGAGGNTGFLAGVKNFFGAGGSHALFKRGDEYVNINGLPYNPADAFFGGVYHLTTADGIGYKIDGLSGDLLSVADGNGNTLTFSDAGIISSTGRAITFGRDPQGRIVSVTDPMGKQVRYQYDARGDLVTVTDRENNPTLYIYTQTGRHILERVIDPLGREGIRSEYEEGRLVKLIDAAGKTVQFVRDPGNSVETILDQLGNATRYEYDSRGNILAEINAVGAIIKRTYDDHNNMLTETAPFLPGDSIWTRTFTYDSDGNVLTDTDPLGNVTRFIYDGFGHAQTSTDPLGHTTTYASDVRGNWLSTRDAAGHLTTFGHDKAGNLTSITDSAGNTIAFHYDRFGNLAREENALGHVTVFTFDDNGNRLTETRTMTTPAGPRTLVTRTKYDNEGELIETTDGENNTTTIEYDAVGNRTATIDAEGRRTVFHYDERGLLTETVYADETPATLTDNPRTVAIYDAAGRLVAGIDELGIRTEFRYDKLDRLTETIYPDETPGTLADNPRTITHYDAAGRISDRFDERNNRTHFEYDEAGRQILIRDAAMNETTFAYDAASHMIAQTDARRHTTRFVYDQLDRLVQTIFVDGTTSSKTYNEMGRVRKEIDQEGRITEFEHDKLGRLTAVKDAMHQRMVYEYDELDNRISQKDANEHTTHYEYDGMGRRTATILPMGQRSATSYDRVGNIVRTVDFNGDTITYEYDSRNRLTAKRFPSGPPTLWTYTPTGQRQTITDGRGVTRYTYDVRARLASRTDSDGRSIGYTYDRTGNQTSVTIPSGTTVYTYGVLNRLETVTDPSLGMTHYFYDQMSNLIRTELPNDTVETREYDDLNRLTFLRNQGTGDLISSYHYTLSPTGRRDAVVEPDGRRVDYTYDALNRLTREAFLDPALGNRTINYTYDTVGNRKTRNDSAEGLTTYEYDDNDRLLSETLAGQTTSYTYDNNGNTRARITSPIDQVFYDWDFENRLRSATITGPAGSRTVDNSYDADGIRIATRIDGEETRYLIDANRPFAQVLEDYTASGTLQAAYVYGHDRISQQLLDTTSYYHMDGLRNVHALTDASGVVTDQYAYDSFGRLLARAGSTDNHYLYTGEAFDTDLGTYYLRARHQDVSTGRFLSRDPFGGFSQLPLSRHKYLYASNNPVNNRDPSGLFTIAESLITVAVHAILSAQVSTSTSAGAVFPGMDTTQSALHRTAFAEAIRVSKLLAADPEPRQTYFGVSSEVVIMQDWQKIVAGLTDPRLTFNYDVNDPECEAGVNAYVDVSAWQAFNNIPALTYTIHICSNYWTLSPLVGRPGRPLLAVSRADRFSLEIPSKAGTLIHEITHDQLGTGDIVRGPSGSKGIVTQVGGSARARLNADNYAWQAEEQIGS